MGEKKKGKRRREGKTKEGRKGEQKKVLSSRFCVTPVYHVFPDFHPSVFRELGLDQAAVLSLEPS